MKCKKKSCQYRSPLTPNIEFCDYIGYTGKPRGCPPEKCDKYKKRTEPRKNKPILISFEKENIIASRKRVMK